MAFYIRSIFGVKAELVTFGDTYQNVKNTQ